MDDSAIMCDGIKEGTVPINLNEKMQRVQQKIFIFALPFLLFTMALLIAVSTYCYLIKHRAKQKHLLTFVFINH